MLGLENEFSLTNLLDRRPADQRHGDDEWRPLHDDPSRPVSTCSSLTALAESGFADARAYAAFSVEETPCRPAGCGRRRGRPAGPTACTARGGGTGGCRRSVVPLLAPVAEGAEAAARAGLLGATPSGWIAVTGSAKHAVYAQTPGHPAVLTADPAGDGWSVICHRSGTAETAGVTAVRRGCCSGDRAGRGHRRDAAVPSGRGRGRPGLPGPWPPGWATGRGRRPFAGASPLGRRGRRRRQLRLRGLALGDRRPRRATADLLAAAWQRFHDRLIGEPPPAPVAAVDGRRRPGLRLAGDVRGSRPRPRSPATTPDTPSASDRTGCPRQGAGDCAGRGAGDPGRRLADSRRTDGAGRRRAGRSTRSSS